MFKIPERDIYQAIPSYPYYIPIHIPIISLYISLFYPYYIPIISLLYPYYIPIISHYVTIKSPLKYNQLRINQQFQQSGFPPDMYVCWFINPMNTSSTYLP